VEWSSLRVLADFMFLMRVMSSIIAFFKGDSLRENKKRNKKERKKGERIKSNKRKRGRKV
jgi:hypothetical protein